MMFTMHRRSIGRTNDELLCVGRNAADYVLPFTWRTRTLFVYWNNLTLNEPIKIVHHTIVQYIVRAWGPEQGGRRAAAPRFWRVL